MAEVPAFLALARSMSADEIHFQMLHDWGSMTKDAFTKAAVHFPTHPRHADFQAALQHIHAAASMMPGFITSDFA